MDIPIAVHVDSGLVETHSEITNQLLQARSLRNTLSILKKRLLNLQADIGHTTEDVQHYKYVLDHLREKWQGEDGSVAGALAAADPTVASQCSTLWKQCTELVNEMEKEAKEMSPEVKQLHDKLVDIREQLKEMYQKEHTSHDVATLINALDSFEAQIVHNGSVFTDLEAPQPGQAVCMELLVHCYELARMCEGTAQDVPKALRSVADELRRIKNALRQLSGRKHHTKADLSHYQYLLTAIRAAEAEYETEWSGSEAAKLMTDCFQILNNLEATAEEMPPEVAEIYDQLALHKQELEGMVSHTVKPTVEQLTAMKKALDAIDNERAHHGGVFGGNGEQEGDIKAPPGQVSCARLLDECYSLLHKLEEGQ